MSDRKTLSLDSDNTKITTKVPLTGRGSGLVPFKPGQSGNPGGRPKVIGDVRDLARAHTPAAIASLHRVMMDEKSPAAAVVAASVAILDRAWGKPSQPTEITGADGAPIFAAPPTIIINRVAIGKVEE